jgi:hypothetical protein
MDSIRAFEWSDFIRHKNSFDLNGSANREGNATNEVSASGCGSLEHVTG